MWMADDGVAVGPAGARESYLASDKIFEVAMTTGTQAIRLVYGFLPEDEDFAEACACERIGFIGPPVSEIRDRAEVGRQVADRT